MRSSLKPFSYIIILLFTFMAYSSEAEALSSCFSVSGTEEPIVDPSFDKEFMQSCFVAQSQNIEFIQESKDMFKTVFYTNPTYIKSIKINFDNQTGSTQVTTQMVSEDRQSKNRQSTFNKIIATIKEKEAEVLFREDIDKQDIVNAFLATLPQDSREDPFWTHFTQLYVNSFSFRIWFRELQMVTNPLLKTKELSENELYNDDILEVMNQVYPYFIEDTKLYKWDTFLLAYLGDESFPEQAFSFQVFIAYSDTNQLIVE